LATGSEWVNFPAPRQELKEFLVRVIGNSGEILTRRRGKLLKLQSI